MKTRKPHDATVRLTRGVLSSLLPKLCSRGTRSFLRTILDAVFAKKDGKPFARSEAKAIFKHILERSDEAFLLSAADFTSSRDPDAFISVVGQGLCLGLTDSVCYLLEDSRREFPVAPLPAGAERWIANFLHDLVKRLQQQQSSLESRLASALKAFFETMLTKGLLRNAPAYPEEHFKVSKDVRCDHEPAYIDIPYLWLTKEET